MLSRLQTIHKPNELNQAAALLDATTRPLYGGVALHRESPSHVVAVVDLSQLGLATTHRDGDTLSLGSMLTLEAARQACMGLNRAAGELLAEMLRQEAPLTLRNTMTLGDLLVERRANSITLTALVALGAIVQSSQAQMTIADWLSADAEQIQQALITAIQVPLTNGAGYYAYQKVSRTPADDPIVGAVAYAGEGLTHLSLGICGVATHPIGLPHISQTLQANGRAIAEALQNLQFNPPADHWGSSEYRAAMGRLLVRRVLEQLLNQV
jgi:CO/xanthine dehydrogenase FAD-binding subunit